MTVMIIVIPSKVVTMGCHCSVVNIEGKAKPRDGAEQEQRCEHRPAGGVDQVDLQGKAPIMVCRSNSSDRSRAAR